MRGANGGVLALLAAWTSATTEALMDSGSILSSLAVPLPLPLQSSLDLIDLLWQTGTSRRDTNCGSLNCPQNENSAHITPATTAYCLQHSQAAGENACDAAPARISFQLARPSAHYQSISTKVADGMPPRPPQSFKYTAYSASTMLGPLGVFTGYDNSSVSCAFSGGRAETSRFGCLWPPAFLASSSPILYSAQPGCD